MDRPQLAVRGDRVERPPVGFGKRPQDQPLPFEDRLAVHRQASTGAVTSAKAATNRGRLFIVSPAMLMRPEPAM